MTDASVVGLAAPTFTASIETYLVHLNDAALIYGVVGGLVFAEVALVVAFFVPGEVSAVIGGVLAGRHVVDLPVMIAVVAGAAVIGNVVGYHLGRWVGPWLLRRRLLAGNRHVERSRDLIERRGGPAVLVGRFIAVVRALVPGLSGIARMPRVPFTVYTVIGGVAWAALWVSVGEAVGLSYGAVLHQATEWTIVAVSVVVVGVLAAFVAHRIRRSRRRPVDN